MFIVYSHLVSQITWYIQFQQSLAGLSVARSLSNSWASCSKSWHRSAFSTRLSQPFVLSLVTSSPCSRTVLLSARLLPAETPDFISEWPLNSPDLNPVDYAIRGILQDRVYRCQICDIDHLKERLIEECGVALIRTLLTEQWISGVIDCVNVSARKYGNRN